MARKKPALDLYALDPAAKRAIAAENRFKADLRTQNKFRARPQTGSTLSAPRRGGVERTADRLAAFGVPLSVTDAIKDVDQNLLGLDETAQSIRNIGAGDGTAGDYVNVVLNAPVLGSLAAKPVEMLAAKAGRGLMRAGERALASRAGRYLTEARPLVDEALTVPARAAAPRSLAARPAMVEPQHGSTAYGTYELAPGVMTRHRQDVLADEGLRERFSLDPATSWQTAEGTDTLYDVLGMPQSPTVRMTGIYEPDVPNPIEESNIGFSARPRLRIGPDGNPIPEDYNAMSGAEAVRAVADTQGAGAWSMPTRPSDPEQAGALFIPTGSPTDIDRMLELRERGKKYGLSGIADLGEGLLMTNFDGLPLGSETAAALRRPVTLGQDNLGLDVRQVLGAGVRPKMVGTTGDYINLAPAWMEPEGSGAVSEILRKYLGDLTPPQREAMLEDPRVAQQFGQRFLRDEQARMAGVPVREDVQRTREAIAEQERLQALFDLIARGRPAMAQGGLVAAGE